MKINTENIEQKNLAIFLKIRKSSIDEIKSKATKMIKLIKAMEKIRVDLNNGFISKEEAKKELFDINVEGNQTLGEKMATSINESFKKPANNEIKTLQKIYEKISKQDSLKEGLNELYHFKRCNPNFNENEEINYVNQYFSCMKNRVFTQGELTSQLKALIQEEPHLLKTVSYLVYSMQTLGLINQTVKNFYHHFINTEEFRKHRIEKFEICKKISDM